jgi:hypothetical protein
MAYHEATKNHEDHEKHFVQKRFVFFVTLRAFVKKVNL